jgi:hypothetical protein
MDYGLFCPGMAIVDYNSFFPGLVRPDFVRDAVDLVSSSTRHCVIVGVSFQVQSVQNNIYASYK